MTLYTSDVLILGSGIAGLFAALRLAEQGNVTLLTKKEASEANTQYAQGGIAAVLDAHDSFDSHIADTLKTGCGLSKPEVVEYVVRRGPEMIAALCQIGVDFSQTFPSENPAKNINQNFSLALEGGHSKRRVLHAGDFTGREIERALLKAVKMHPRIRLLEHTIAIDLILREGRAVGVYALDDRSGAVETFSAKAVVLATGGAGKVYLYTSNPDIATGDGMAMAKRAGAPLVNMEFVQFHPTCLYHPKAKSFLLSEALRGEGAILKTVDGRRFMENIHPLKELAPRDVVARAIDMELKKSGRDYVLLDISHKPAEFIRARFPTIYETCLQYGFDLSQWPIPVVPAAHYFCGGVPVNLAGETPIAGLYAIGETAHTGLHGANRLASNSLLEAVVFADSAASAIHRSLPALPAPASDIPPWNPGLAKPSEEQVVVAQTWHEIRWLMWNYVGIVRSTKRLLRAKKRIDILKDEIAEYYWSATVTRDLIELRNILTVAEAIVASALTRHESRGLHEMADYPNLSPETKDTAI